MRAVDQNALVELRSRWFADQVRKISSWMLWLLATCFILGALSASVLSPLIYSRFTSAGSGITSSLIKSTVLYLLWLHSWPFIIALFLRVLKWPQLMPAASIAFFAIGANSLPYPIGGIVSGAMSGNWLAAATPALLVLDPGTWQSFFGFSLAAGHGGPTESFVCFNLKQRSARLRPLTSSDD